MNDSERERIIDRRVMAILATDSEYRNAENAEQQSARERAIEDAVGRALDAETVGSHYHVAYGIAGYGPEGEDSGYFTTLAEAVDYARDCLRESADSCYECANDLAGSAVPDHVAAWNEMKHGESLAYLAGNLNPARALAPLYRDDPALWDAELARIVGERFPVDVSTQGATRLYVWECDSVECADDSE